ncbi:hypothetical protein M422DRAFT_784418 [Sphaerobolus stellatus SS14]|uniref:Enoyl reductase (ER) domain-containing protein n=1 Tax=Sphaerobolus stellatus (strain SS14) TaxID=990650 RepID=A0A0C9U497_SPHS4|nr:hypothetical protein M422DRAFT_784418 [Sphaerobolus stellatus SS14]
MPSIVPNNRLVFNKVPTGYPVPGETTRIDTNEKIDLDAPLNGGVLIKVVVVAIDPYLRGRMRDASIKSYAPPFLLGEPITNFGVGLVIRSENPNFKQGDRVYGTFEFQKYVIKHDTSNLIVLKNEEKLPWTAYLGVCGMPGQTAYIGWKLYAQAKKGETVFVTTAAGPVGSNVVQIAKSEGLKVIASAGSDEKVEFIKSLGADVVFNYKKKDTLEALKELGHGIDIYWDHVGGKMLEDALSAMNDFGRIVVCGAIAGYNNDKPYAISNLHYVLTKRLTMHGFIVLDLLKDHIQEFYSEYPKRITSGQVKHHEQIYKGLEGAEQALLDTLKGDNQGKPVAVLSEEDL